MPNDLVKLLVFLILGTPLIASIACFFMGLIGPGLALLVIFGVLVAIGPYLN